MRDRRAAYALWIAFAINAVNFFDRTIAGPLGEPIRKEWSLSDGALGALGTAFTLLYALVGIPLGRLADRLPRRSILAAAVFAWSILTSLSGMTRTFWQLFVTRLGVGAGEAACAPAATSLIGDYYPPERRARALSLFMLGLPIGIALSSPVGAYLAYSWGWRAAFLVAGIPGVLCAIAALLVVEPPRGMKEATAMGARRREGSPWRVLLSIPTVWWLILSGALHNFNMYALGSFVVPLLIRYYHIELRYAGLTNMVVYGLSGIPGLLAGGALADRWARRRRDGRLLVGTAAIAVSVPLLFAGISRPPDQLVLFFVFATLGVMSMYVYYASVYASLHDVVEPSLRGTAMAVYFFAMYVLGASFGPIATGLASDFFTRLAARGRPTEAFRGVGLHSAMYLVPLLSVLLALVLFAASRTIGADVERMQRALREEGA